jgi:acyl carrier protein
MDQPSPDEMLAAIRVELEKIAPEVGAERLSLDTDIATLGIESVTMLELIAALEERFAIELPDDELTTLDTLGDVIALLQRHVAAGSV